MIKFNILTEAFIQNVPPVSGSLRSIEADELDSLISSSGGSVSVSGQVVNLHIDLGAQKSIDSFSYTFSPLSLSGVSVRYGRELSDLTTGIVSILGPSLVVEPTISGYTYPRYIQLTHTVPSGSPAVSLERLSVFNTEDEIEFGTSGTGFIDSLTLVGNSTGGLSDVIEVPVTNSGTIPSDIFVSIDTAFADPEVLRDLEISSNESGPFYSTNPDLSFPTTVPFEWGSFNGLTVGDDGLKLVPEDIFPDLAINTEFGIANQGTADSTNNTHTERAIDADGDHVLVRIRENHSLAFIDPLRKTITLTSTPSYAVSNGDEQHNTHLAWDGADRIYWLNGKDTQEIQMYTISTNSFSVFTTVSGFYNRLTRPAAHFDGYLYVGGARSDAGSSNSAGAEFWRIRVSDQTEEQLDNMPETPADNNAFVIVGNYLYYEPGTENGNFYRYDLDTGNWEILADHGVSNVLDISADETNNRVLLINQTGDVYEFNTLTTSWDGIAFSVNNSPNIVYGGLGLEDTIYVYCRNFSGITTRARVLGTDVPEPNLDITSSGTWTSPIIKIESDGNYNRPIFDLNLAAGAEMKFDQSIGVANFEVRGSDVSPAAENTFQLFDEEIDPDEFLTANFDENSIVVASGGVLTFSHTGNVGELTSSYLYYGFPLNTNGKMQYKFWWNPSSDKQAGSDHFSAFYIVPFLDSINLGILPTRDSVTLRRADDDNIYLRFGQDSDSGGSFTQIQFYNGSSINSMAIDAESGSYYEVVLNIDWDLGDYSVYFAGELVGTGTVPQIRIDLLNTQHSYELFSAGEEVSFEERFKYLTISRVGNTVINDNVAATPIHREDPLYGDDGSLEWTPVTVNSPLLPKTDYVQFRLTLRSTGGPDQSVVNAIDFIPILTLSGVQPGESDSVYLRYNFPAANSLSTNELALKAWTRTDKL